MDLFQALYIGDSRRVLELEMEESDSLIRPGSVHLVVTSPPYYGAPMWDSIWQMADVHWEKDYKSPDKRPEAMTEFQKSHDWLKKVWEDCFRMLSPGGRLIVNTMDVPNSVNGKWMNAWETTRRCQDIGYVVREDVIWGKGKQHLAPNGSAPYPGGVLFGNLYEHILVFQKPGVLKHLHPEMKEASKLTHDQLRWIDADYWMESEFQAQSRLTAYDETVEEEDFYMVKSVARDVDRLLINTASAKEEQHVAPFPIEIPKRLIALYTFIGDVVMDPFLGSGTTMKAAVNLQRSSIGIEVDPAYTDVIKKKVGWGNRSLTDFTVHWFEAPGRFLF